MARGLGQLPEGFRRFRYRAADGERLHFQGGILLVHAAEGHQRVYQLRQLFRLGLCLVDPFLMAHLHLQHLQAGGNDGDGGFQLVAGVGDELLLLLGAAHHGVDGPAAQQHHQQEHQQRADRVGGQRPDQHRADSAQLLIAVQKDGHVLAVSVGGHKEAVAAAVAAARAFFQGGGQIRRGIILRHGGDLAEIGVRQCAVRVIAQHEVAGGEGGLRCEVAVPAVGLSLGRYGRRHIVAGGLRYGIHAAGEGNGALIFVDQGQGAAQVGVGGDVVGHIQDRRQQQHHRRHRQRGDADKPVAQTLYHASSSRA